MPASNKKMINIPLNRVEGDLELHLELDGDRIANSWSSGIMFRGFENILRGRAPRDGLVLTPRVCGICGTAHLLAAAKALDMLCGVIVPDNAVMTRNLTLLAEHIQSDIRHGILMFMNDFINPLYQDQPFYSEARLRYEPFRGTSVIKAIRETKKILEIIAIVGGQWPNTSFMVPGGIATTPTFNDMVGCDYIERSFTGWYEREILGCSLERWAEVTSLADLDTWLEEKPDHTQGDLGFFIRCARMTGLDRIGGGHGNFISTGLKDLQPYSTRAVEPLLMSSGFIAKGEKFEFDQALIAEHVAFSRFEGYGSGLHPFEGITIPAFDPNPDKYSWAKAPRYNDHPAETGPLAEALIDGDPLFADLVRQQGPTAFSRELARFTRPAKLLPLMKKIIRTIDPKAPYYRPVGDIPDGRAYGLIEACRGTLGHWLEVQDGAIARYQIITPTAWNGSPRDANAIRGPWEEAIIGTSVKDPDNPVELGHIIRSFDACLVCAVHFCTRK
ncbi:MAG: nickel-dependent hydrogenase large subunit [Desulfocapsaceae bacterium]|nr:nickel-dependent hydrogenase large subunit [Desulfocapsaceae bacterium]